MAQRKPADPAPETDPITEPPAAPEGEPAPPQPGEPAWARELKQLITDLPGKLRATVTDDDRRSISEQVHDLFERSGAFHPPPKDEDPPEDDDAGEDPPAGKKDSWARRVFGEH